MRRILRSMVLAAGLSACSAKPAGSLLPAAGPIAEPSPEARAILTKMNERYANAKTYRDEGTYRDAFRDLDGTLKETRTGRFKTRWRSSPDRMVFVLQDEGRGAAHDRLRVLAVWSSDGGAKQLLEGHTTELVSLDLALGAMQGVTHGLTKLVPRWLLDRGSRRYLNWTVRGRTTCGDNHECWHLEAPREDGKGTIAYFVDVETSALRRFTAHTTIGQGNAAFIVDDEVNLTPTFDEPLPDYELVFDPMLP